MNLSMCLRNHLKFVELWDSSYNQQPDIITAYGIPNEGRKAT
jgi:hypothetical protein